VLLEKVFFIRVSRPDLENALAALLKHPLYFELSDGMVGRVFVPELESVFSSNIAIKPLLSFHLYLASGKGR
jgi:hypothetical protein